MLQSTTTFLLSDFLFMSKVDFPFPPLEMFFKCVKISNPHILSVGRSGIDHTVSKDHPLIQLTICLIVLHFAVYKIKCPQGHFIIAHKFTGIQDIFIFPIAR